MAGAAIQRRTIARTFTVSANTTSSAPQSASLSLGQTQIESLRLRIPRGHVGLTGFAFRYGQARIIPWDDASLWVSGDDEIYDMPLYLDVSVPITLLGFNTDIMQHSFYLSFVVDDEAYLQNGKPSTLIIPV